MKKNRSIQSILIFFLAISLCILNSCTERHYDYGTLGIPAFSKNGKFVTVLVAETQVTTKQVNAGYRSSDYSSTYWLKLYETATGKLVKKKKLVSDAEKQNIQVSCYGGYGNNIWLHTYGLVAYDLNTLEEVVTEEILAKQNNMEADQFPIDQRMYNELLSDGSIYFTGLNGNKYRIDLSTLTISPEKALPRNIIAKINEQQFSKLPNHINYGERLVKAGSNMFILAKDSSSALNLNPNNTTNDPVNKTLTLFTAGFTIREIANHSFYDYTQQRKLPGDSYINGYFLKDESTNEVVQLKNPAGYLILHRDSLNNEASMILSAIDWNNNIIWKLNTGLSTKIAHCVVKDTYLILTGNKHYIVGPPVGSDKVGVVDLSTGKKVTLSIEE
jgi:uncharacterized membrane protein YccF (DUF307 family)